ncbi:MAG TPA: DNA ligase [Acidimicrobiaceae bacterium]|nr:DNA ligase [Acidimicrobiaceae bacterium]
MIEAVPELETYRSKRRPDRTPEPSGRRRAKGGASGNRFVIQEHHARALHWDFRLERDGVLVSWAVPKGLPVDRHTNRLAKHTEDHPLEYIDFEGDIPAGEYGGGRVILWDTGHYDLEKWSDDEVKVVLHGRRVDGEYVLFRTKGDDWMVHRMDHGGDDVEAVPDLVQPMSAVAGKLPRSDDGWAFEFKWDGVRAVAYVDGGRLRLMSRNGRDVTVSYPELRAMGEALGSRPCVLDGEIVAFDESGRPSFAALQERMHVAEPGRARRLSQRTPVAYLAFDVLHLDGHSMLSLPYEERRRRLEDLGLTGDHWQTPPSFPGPGREVLDASLSSGLEGVVAKRLGSPYLPGRRSSDWVKVKHVRTQEVIVVGWTPGQGRRQDRIGALLLAVPRDGEPRYAGKVGTGFTEHMLDDLGNRLAPLERKEPPVSGPLPRAHVAGATWVEPTLVGEVAFNEWTRDGRLRQPSWRGLRPDKEPGQVVVES